MSFNYDLYQKYSEADVWLEENQHVYIHKKTQERFISMTTALKLIKTPLAEQDILDGLTRQYTTFFEWAKNINLPFYKIPRLLHLYVNYKNFRPYVMAEYKRKPYKKYKKLNTLEYPNFLIFEREFLPLERKHKSEIERFKNIYLNQDGSKMNRVQIKEFWQDITDIANVYGTMVHEIVEQYILLKQFFITKNHKIEQNIHTNFLKLKELDQLFEKKYKYTLHTFEEYKIDCSYEEFKEHIISSFLSLNCNLGRVCVPEKVLYYEKYKICGTEDVYVDLTETDCDIGDHKTNKNLTTESEYDTYYKYPFNYLQQCEFNTYSFQMSGYGVINQEVGKKKVNNLWISYYNRQPNAFQLYEIPFLEKEAKEIFRIFKNYLDKRLEVYLKNGILQDVPTEYHNHLIKIIDDDIQKRTENKTISKSKRENKKYYQQLVKDYIDLQKTIKYEGLS